MIAVTVVQIKHQLGDLQPNNYKENLVKLIKLNFKKVKNNSINSNYIFTEARIEQAKRIQRNSEYRKLPDNEPCENASSVNTSLIPIQRLAIPQKRKKHNTLIEYWHSDSERYAQFLVQLFNCFYKNI